MTRNPSKILVATAVLAMASAHAETPPVQPGLWKYTVKVKSQSGQIENAITQAQAQLAKLPPEQRAAVEKMMAARGVSMDAGTTSVKICLTKEDAERGSVPLNLQKGNCTQQWLSSEGNTAKVSFSCQTEPPASGTGEITVLSPTSVTSRAVVDTVVAGQPEQLNLAQQGTWLAEDCGGIAPLGKGDAAGK